MKIVKKLITLVATITLPIWVLPAIIFMVFFEAYGVFSKALWNE